MITLSVIGVDPLCASHAHPPPLQILHEMLIISRTCKAYNDIATLKSMGYLGIIVNQL